MLHNTTKMTALTLFSVFSAATVQANDTVIQPIQSTIAEETFQTVLVSKGLEALGYQVNAPKEVDYNVAYASVANGDATFLATNWSPLHNDKYEKAGGDNAFYRQGVYVNNAVHGYLIDKKTADKYGITNIGQLKDPAMAKLFDHDGDGKANLTGCNPGWGCERAINEHFDIYQLGDTIEHDQGNYSALIANTIARYKNGEPVLYYTWTPYWVSGVLVPGKDVVWLEVPKDTAPGKTAPKNTALPNGKDYGFTMNTINIIANKAFAQQHPDAAKLFSLMKLPLSDINAQNMAMRQGQNSTKDIERHVDGWIKAHQAEFDNWVAQAKAAKK
ncbi:glycine betaine/L-proline ABC transporter substrate-binding protein ProX [Necropsobacter rosorum]|uniref:glycine betaine/L-proline ABC transporter substrate-binding protein ProX n=1 Tax=Necropsobacter rosorum TaxID=908285 RepID=UPI000509D10A